MITTRHSLLSSLLLIWALPTLLTAQSITVDQAFPLVRFSEPVGLANDGTSNLLYVVEQPGIIKVFENNPTTAESRVFLDIRSRIRYGGEQGLLGLAFDPDYATNGYLYVNYTASNPQRTVVSRFSRMAGDSLRADSLSERVIIEIYQPYNNHNGGALVFGDDGYLYIAMGDGGNGGDPQNRAQNLDSLLGKILRIDVSPTNPDSLYDIPEDNPFASLPDDSARGEIWAYGLRNPWRITFDSETGWLWAGDVGQGLWEEVDVIERGGNYGWKIREGAHCYPGSVNNCDTTGLIDPIWEYDHSSEGGVSITGGYVYRSGTRAPSLQGEYIYADYLSGRIWGLTYNGSGTASNRLIVDSDLLIPSFGTDREGELYVVSSDGYIYAFTQLLGAPLVSASEHFLDIVPNPTHSTIRVELAATTAGNAHITLADMMGRIVQSHEVTVSGSGIHSILLDTDNLPAGAYTVVARMGTRQESSIVIIVR